ncbi:MAG: radical SAM protein [Candidatus Zixiibacteriota bacterium]
MNNINGIRGWYFDPEVIAEANKEGRLLTMDYELGAACPLKCIYCYRTGDSRDYEKGLMDFPTWKRVVDEAKELGCQSMKLIGGGEITLDKHFVAAMEYMANKGIIPVLFTAGQILGNEELCHKIYAKSCREMGHWMYDLGMSIFLKFDAINNDLQDYIAGAAGYARIRDRALQLLIEIGFNQFSLSRLGLEVNVSRHNYHEMMDIYALRTKYNLYEDVVISMPCDMYFKNADYDISLDQKKELYRNIYDYNIEHNIPFDTLSPFIGGLECTQLGNGLYVTNRGDVYHCPGAFDKLGNVKETSLNKIWNEFLESRSYHENYFCPFREQTNIIPTEIICELKEEMTDKYHQICPNC